MELVDILLIVIVSLWTIMISMIQINYLSHWSKTYLPLEATGKILNVLANFLLVCTMWLNVFIKRWWFSWVLMAIALVLILIWMYITRLQRRYMTEKLTELVKKIEKEDAKIKKFHNVVRQKGRKNDRQKSN